MSTQGNDRTPESRRDSAIEKILSRHSGAMASPVNPCPDAEVLAAYVDHTLGENEATRWETHFATCERCQDILGALAASAPVEELQPQYAVAAAASATPIAVAHTQAPAHATQPSIVIKPARAKNRYWIFGVAAAAAVIAYFIIFRAPSNPISSQEQTAAQIATQNQNQTAQATPPSGVTSNGYVPVPQAADSKLPKSNSKAGKTSNPPVNLQEATREPQISITPVVSSEPGNAGAAPSAVGGAIAGYSNSPRTETDSANASASKEQTVGAPATAAVSPAMKKQAEDKTSSRFSNPNALSKRNLDEAVAASQAQANTQQAAAPPPAPSQISGAFKARARDAGSPSDLSAVLVFPSQGNVVWSVGLNGSIEKSADSGGTWQAQQSGVTAQLLAGSAPNEAVCWVVGRNGTILRTTDGGATWIKVPNPQSLGTTLPDWIGVFASDPLHARINSVDRQRFATSDGGQTWTAVTQ